MQIAALEFVPAGTCNLPFAFFRLHKKRVAIYSTGPKPDIAVRRFWWEDMVTHRFPLEEPIIFSSIAGVMV